MPVPTTISIEVQMNASLEAAWNAFLDPKAITRWNAASADWHCPRAVNDLREGGRFSYRMESVDGKYGFDFSGTFTVVTPQRLLEFVMDDDRKVRVEFSQQGKQVRVHEQFEAETENSLELQKNGWQAILDKYKTFVEGV